jgi:hypothetical protein
VSPQWFDPELARIVPCTHAGQRACVARERDRASGDRSLRPKRELGRRRVAVGE